MLRKAIITLFASVIAPVFAFGIVVETVNVGNLGNTDDTTGYGGVDYSYQISKFEITAGQYAAFLNSVAGVDTYGLYNTEMFNSVVGCKIQRISGSGTVGDPYQYAVAVDRADRPVNYVSWGDAARFANWMHNGQASGMQDTSTTEDGTYFLNGATSNTDLMAIAREADGTWAIPTADEWYKAAYHYNDGDTNNYYLYPTSSDTTPSNLVGDPDPGNNANYSGSDFAIGDPYYMTEVGEYENSLSPYGTFDQGGNVEEWTEAALSNTRMVRGGAWDNGDFALESGSFDGYVADNEINHIGFRLVNVPEPSTLVVLAPALAGLLSRRRRRES